jgi:uncharacterized membrane protein
VFSLILHLLIPSFVRAFFRTIKRYPLVFVAITLLGQFIGAWLTTNCFADGDWPMTALGVYIFAFYTGLLGMVIVKWWNGTWDAFCDFGLSQFE